MGFVVLTVFIYFKKICEEAKRMLISVVFYSLDI